MNLLRQVRRLLHIPPKIDPLMLADFKESNKFTPDIPYLERFDCQKIFVFDDMQLHHPNHERMGHNMRLVPAAYTVDPFVLWKKKLGLASYAIPLKAKEFSSDRQWSLAKGIASNIRGGLYVVRPYQIIDVLDKHYQNGIEFERIPVEIFYPYKTVTLDDHLTEVWSKENIATTWAWMYVGRKEFWDHIEARQLDPVRMFAPNNRNKPPYYLFTAQEYRE